MEICPTVKKWIVESGVTLIKTWLEVGMGEQDRRFMARITDPLRQWKLSPMDLEAYGRWDEYSKARDKMLAATDTDYSPWYILYSDDKKRARLNGISHILSLIPYRENQTARGDPTKEVTQASYDDQSGLRGRKIVPQLN